MISCERIDIKPTSPLMSSEQVECFCVDGMPDDPEAFEMIGGLIKHAAENIGFKVLNTPEDYATAAIQLAGMGDFDPKLTSKLVMQAPAGSEVSVVGGKNGRIFGGLVIKPTRNGSYPKMYVISK